MFLVEFAYPIRPSRLHRTPSPADKPWSGSNWIHEIKYDGYRFMARRDPVGIRLLTRRGNDWSARFPLIVEAVNHLKVGSCLIDGEVECCDERGFLRQRRSEACAFFAFDLLELDGTDMRREPIEVRKATLASILGKRRPGARLNEHLEHPDGALVFAHTCKLGVEGIVSKRLGSRYRSGRSPDWLKFKNPHAPAVKRDGRGLGPVRFVRCHKSVGAPITTTQREDQLF
jgi:bifunctional non-homologous end joining protein LigD